MLTTSSTPGHAMKFTLLDINEAEDFEQLKEIISENEQRRNSMLGNQQTFLDRFLAPTSLVLGKALEPLEQDSGKIMALITLQ